MTPDPKRYPRSGHVFVALVVSIALWAFMVFWTLAYLRRISGGLEPFDLRPFGYDLAKARALLFALSEFGRDYYLNIQLQLDTAYPFTYALSRVLLLWWLSIPGRIADFAIPVTFRLALAALPLVTAACDYVENDAIAAMDADVISLESARSQMELLQAFADNRYANDIGHGVYEVHSPRVPETAEMISLLNKALQVIAPERLWVNPDCGLKTRRWDEVVPSLNNMVSAAVHLRRNLQRDHN